MEYIKLTPETIESEHICCAFSDKKCTAGYAAKKQWLTAQFKNDYVFQRLDERAKVFIEYGPAEKAWVPVDAPDYVMLGCFWVSGKYKGEGHGKALLDSTIKEAKKQGKKGLVAMVGGTPASAKKNNPNKKFHFLSDNKWLFAQGFETCDQLDSGFQLLVLDFKSGEEGRPVFNAKARKQKLKTDNGCVVYYSNRCPYTEYYVNECLTEACEKRGIPLEIIKLDTMKKAQAAPTPATIFSLFMDGEFVTTDVSACLDSRFDKIVK